MCGDLWADVLQDIVRRSPDLDQLTVTMAFTCSKMRVDGFGGLAMLITAETIRSESTNTLFDRFYTDAQVNGEIGHGNSCVRPRQFRDSGEGRQGDRKSTGLNSRH